MEWLRDGDQKLLVQLEALAREATRRAPDSPTPWLTLARLQRWLGAPAGAEASLDAASAAVRGDPARQAQLARDLTAQTESDRSLAEVDRVLAGTPGGAGPRRLRLRLRLPTKRYAAAQAMVESGEPFDPAAFGAL